MADRPLPELIDGSDGPNISFNGKVLYAGSLSPEKRAEAAVSASQTLYLVLSPLLFIGVQTLLDNITDDSFILAVEKNPDIYSLTKNFAEPFESRLSYCLLTESVSAASVIRELDPSRFRRIVTVKLNGGYMLERAYYNSFSSAAETFIQNFWKNRMTSIHMSRLWCRNIFMNIPVLSQSDSLSSLSTDKPVIIAGAGESLEGCLPFMKENRNRFFIIAADTAVSSLLDAGIRADLLVVLEAQHANLYDFYKPESLELPAAFDMTSSPEIIRKHSGKKYFFISEFDRTRLIENIAGAGLMPPRIPPLGSVGIAAVYIALCITRRRVFHCGLDFSFVPDKYHSAGSPSHIITMMRESRTAKPGFYASAFNGNRIRRADKSGRAVYTDLIMLSYSDRLSELSSLSGRLVDIAAGGLDSASMNVTDHDDILAIAGDGFETAEAAAGTAGTASGLFGLERVYGFAGRNNYLNFLNSELKKTEKIKDDVIEFLNSRTDEAQNLPPELYELIRDADYTYLFFPDYYTPSADASFLKRLLFSTTWYADVIRKTISGCS